MNILMIGGNGYLGSMVTNALSNKGHLIVCTRLNGSDISNVTGRNVIWIPATVEAVETAFNFTTLIALLILHVIMVKIAQVKR